MKNEYGNEVDIEVFYKVNRLLKTKQPEFYLERLNEDQITITNYLDSKLITLNITDKFAILKEFYRKTTYI